MNYILLGLGNIGAKRLAILGERCKATVDPYNKEADYTDLRQVDPSTYDAVVMSVPNSVKIELMRQCLQMGKHVLVEKPLLFPDDKTAQELHQLAKRNHAIWYTSYNHRFEPLIEEAKKEIDAGVLGKFYHGHLFYGNGTVANVNGSWRENGLGVLEDLGCHLFDLAGFLLGYRGSEIEAWSLAKREAKALDHCIVATKDKRLTMEMSFLSWKNNCKIELVGENGAIHLQGLCKWTGSELTVFERSRPSGPPKVRHQKLTGPDVTWKKDIDFFETQVAAGKTSFENDRWISQTLERLSA